MVEYGRVPGKGRGKFATRMGYANFEGVMRISHNLEQLAYECHIFLISAPNSTWFEALDS